MVLVLYGEKMKWIFLKIKDLIKKKFSNIFDKNYEVFL